MNLKQSIEKAYEIARERYAILDVDTDQALRRLKDIPLTFHCWQGDDVAGFEREEGLTGGGIQVTGNYPGRARNGDELRADLDKTYSLVPGRHRLNLHAIYAETGGKKLERNKLQPEHFQFWVDWAGKNRIGLDFNPSCFSHPLADNGLTLSSHDKGIRTFWIEHCIASRKIGESFGRRLGTPCVTNIWIPDGYKDIPADRKTPRDLLADSLDQIFAEKISGKYNLDALESKLFGIGSESYVVGSHEFYMGYAMAHQKLLCLDTGHFHPTEQVSDKISAILKFLDRILLHISRGVRWDSDHVAILSDELLAIAKELVRGSYLDRVHIGLDFFDGSINRVAAWVIGGRSMIKALLSALLEPAKTLVRLERSGDFTGRLALLEEIKTLPLGAVWDYYCLTMNVPVGIAWLDDVRSYEKKVLFKRK